MADNPNPSRITAAWWWFGQELLKLDSGTELSGFYGDKPGYHNTRAGNLSTDYSVRAAADKLGPSDKSAAVDWTFHSAQRGDYGPMARRGAYLNAAFDARDPRLAGWREALGQTDPDKAAEGLDFQGWYRRVPDSSHEWHWHFSEVRAHVESRINKEALLSVLRGETLAAYLARGGQLISNGGNDMSAAGDLLNTDVVPNRPWRGDFKTNPTVRWEFAVTNTWDLAHAAAVDAAEAVRIAKELAARPTGDTAALAAAIVSGLLAGGVASPPSAEEIAALVDAKLAARLAS